MNGHELLGVTHSDFWFDEASAIFDKEYLEELRAIPEAARRKWIDDASRD